MKLELYRSKIEQWRARCRLHPSQYQTYLNSRTIANIKRYPGLSLINKGDSNSGREDFKQNIGKKYTSYQYLGPGQADKIVGSVKVLNSLYHRYDAAWQFN